MAYIAGSCSFIFNYPNSRTTGRPYEAQCAHNDAQSNVPHVFGYPVSTALYIAIVEVGIALYNEVI